MIGKLLRQLRRLRRSDDSGAVSVEMALTVWPLFLLVAGAADFGAVVNTGHALQAATRSVAEYARNSPDCAAGGLTNSNCVTGINNFVSSIKSTDSVISTATFTPSSTAVGVGNYCTCVDNSVVANCSTGTCSVAGDTRVIQYIRVTATQTATPIISLFSPTLPTAKTTIRVQ